MRITNRACIKKILTTVVTIVSVMAVVGVLQSCGTSKNTAYSRQYQAFTTRYNVYYNGSEHYKEQLQQMEKSYQDDYSRRLLMHPAEARADEKLPQPTGDFKRTIEKMQKAIQLHSISKKPAKRNATPKDKAFRAREEFNPFLHNAWLMMGRAQFFNGDFMGAAATFAYTARHYKWNSDIVTESNLWQARCYCALGWTYEAENILTHIKPERLESVRLRDLYDYVEADYLVHADRAVEAIPFLTRAAQKASGTQKQRLYFLLGQILADKGDKKAAYEAFGKAAGGSGTDYRAKFNARIKQSEVFTGTDIRKEVNALKAMTRYQRNSEYLDQIYYAIGNLYLSRRDTTQAEKNYRLALEKSTRNGIDKALASLALGEILFARHDYVKAQPCYSEAVPQLQESYPGYKTIKLRSDVLDELATYAGNVQLQDSLLTLSKMTPEEQEKVAKRLAEEYKKKEKEAEEEARRQEHAANQAAQGSQINDRNAPTQFQMNTDKSWYFYNNQAKAAGKTEFQRRWGARKLEDDWRRRNKNTFSLNENNEDTNVGENGDVEAADSISAADKEKLDKEADPREPEYYLKSIPRTETEIVNCNDIIQEGMYNIGIILKDKLEDFPEARREFTELDTRYPDNVYRLDVYYNMYLMAVRENDMAQAEHYRLLIIREFPESSYGQAMTDPAYFDNLRRMTQLQDSLYTQAYQAYLENNNTRVRTLTAEMEKDFPLSKILPKFKFLDALTYVSERDEDKFKEKLTALLDKWPDTDMTPMASGMLNYLKQGRTLHPSADGNVRGMLWDTRLISNPDSVKSDGSTPANFDLDPSKPQLLVLAFPLDSVNPNQLLYDVARHNFSTFTVKDFDLEQMNFGNVGLLIIKGFANVKEVEHYRRILARGDYIQLPTEVRPIMISEANFQTLLREGRSFEEYFRFEEDQATRATEEKVVGKDNYLPGGPNDPDLPSGEMESESEAGQGTPESEGESELQEEIRQSSETEE